MTGYVTNIEKQTLENTFFRKVLFTGQHEQLVVMALQPGEDIGLEVHGDTDQFLRIEAGEGKIILNGDGQVVSDGSAILVTAGTEHNLVNMSAELTLKLYTIYSPPHHPDGTLHETKAEAMAAEE